MTKLLFATLACVFAASAVFAALGDVVASFPAPAANPIALATTSEVRGWVPGGMFNITDPVLWVFCNVAPYEVYMMIVLDTPPYHFVFWKFQSPLFWATRGLTVSDGRGGMGGPPGLWLWMGNSQQDKIYRCNPFFGFPFATFPANHDMGGGLAVMAVHDNGKAPRCMLSSDDSPKYVYGQKFTGGSSWYFLPSAKPFDLAWDWRNRLVWTGCDGNMIYGYRTNGSLYASFTIPSTNPRGFAYNENYLYVSTLGGATGARNHIWKIHCPRIFRLPYRDDTSINPASIGKIKAVFK